MKQRNQGEEKP